MMRIKTRIARLEQREGVDASGPIPVSVIDRVIAGTSSDWEYERWGPAFDRIIAAADAPKPALIATDSTEGPASYK